MVFQGWQHDSTIHGATGDAGGHSKGLPWMRPKNSTESYSRLNAHHFDVLNLGSLGLSDEIYIKMNAREGTDGFEKFKAWLIGTHCETNEFRWPLMG